MADRDGIKRHFYLARFGGRDVDLFNLKRRAKGVAYGGFDGLHSLGPPLFAL